MTYPSIETFQKWVENREDDIPRFMHKYGADPWWETIDAPPLPYVYSVSMTYDDDKTSWAETWQSFLNSMEAAVEAVGGNLGRWSYAPPYISGVHGFSFYFDDKDVAATFKLMVALG